MENKYGQLKSDVYDEIDAIEQTLHELSTLRAQIDITSIDNVQKAAIGTFLMNFYVGVENIIKRISKVYYKKIPMGHSWHKELLELSFNPPEGKLPIFEKNLVEKLTPYLGFRHVFVSGYGFKLKIELMSSLIDNSDSVWDEIRKEIDRFWDSLDNSHSVK